MQRFSDIAFSPAVEDYQRLRGSLEHYREAATIWPAPEALGPDEIEFLTERDSFYLASVGEGGWPYVQHRGGLPGFIHVTGPSTIAWLDRPGNKQFVSAGNLAASDKVAIIAVDYAARRRIKLYGHATFNPAPDATAIEPFEPAGRVEGLITVEVAAFDWNCPKLITPRYTVEQIREITNPMTARIEQLEQELAYLRAGATH
jgi:uncharacterized protein